MTLNKEATIGTMPNLDKKKKANSLDRRKARAGWIFVLPFIIGFVFIYLPIIIDSISYSFANMQVVSGSFRLNFIGFKNYTDALLVDSTFVKTLTSGIQQLIFEIPAIVIFSLFMAVLLNQKMVGRAAFRAILFLPVILVTGLIDEIDAGNDITASLSEASEGVDLGTGAATAGAGGLLEAMNFEALFSSIPALQGIAGYITGIVSNIYGIINRSGVQMLIFLAGLQGINPAIYESCSIEGASAWETFWKITFPMISPMILVNAIYTVIDSFTTSQNKVMTYISKVYSQSGGETLSSAMSWIYFLIVMLIIGIVAAILSAYVFYQRRD